MTCVIQCRVYLGLSQSPDVFRLDDSLLGGPDVLDGGGTDPDTYAWTEVSQWVESPVVTRKGGGSSSSILFRSDGGRCSFTLANLDGRFDPHNTSGPYYGTIGTGVAVLVQATITGVGTRTVWVGSVDDWAIDYWNDQWSEVRVTASDDVEALQALNPGAQAIPLPVQGSDERCNAILDVAGWPSSLRAVESSSDMSTWEQQSTDLGQSIWAELQLAADSADAWVWLDASGVVHVEKQLPTSLALTIGNTTGAIPATRVEVATQDRARLANLIELRMPYASTPTTLTSEDLESQSRYGVRSWGRSDLMSWPGLLLYFLAGYLCARWKDPLPWQIGRAHV